MTTKEQRVQKLLDGTFRLFYHPCFDEAKERKAILADMPGAEKFNSDKSKIAKLRSTKITPEMRPCYEAPLLTPEQEQHLFRKMNYLKYRAKKLLANINLARVGEKRLAAIESYLNQATAVRNQIANSNFRLATQILKGQITFYREHSLTEGLLSDAYFDVMKAVDYFNWTLGNRFSTYATWVVKNNFFRDSKQKITYAERFGHLDDARAEKQESRGSGYEDEKAYEDKQTLVKHLLKLLSEGDNSTDRLRQVYVLENYFGINGRNKKTLEEISAEIGVTKERVRQLKEKGLLWIKNKTIELGIESDSEIED